jgi:hypothetical protein
LNLETKAGVLILERDVEQTPAQTNPNNPAVATGQPVLADNSLKWRENKKETA